MRQMNDKTFLNELIDNFPEIRDELSDEDFKDLIYLQIGCFKRFTQSAIDKEKLDVVKKCFQFIENRLDSLDQKVENAVYISYLSKLEIKKNSKTEKLLSKKMKSIIFEFEKYEKSNSKNEKLNDFLKNI